MLKKNLLLLDELMRWQAAAEIAGWAATKYEAKSMINRHTDGRLDRVCSWELARIDLYTLAAKKKTKTEFKAVKKKTSSAGIAKSEEQQVQGGPAGLRTRVLVLHSSEHNMCYWISWKHIFYRQSCCLKASQAGERTLPESFNQTDCVSQGEVSRKFTQPRWHAHCEATHCCQSPKGLNSEEKRKRMSFSGLFFNHKRGVGWDKFFILLDGWTVTKLRPQAEGNIFSDIVFLLVNRVHIMKTLRP